jgi:hypothetical protein
MKATVIAIIWAASLFLAYRAGHIVSNRFDYSPPTEVRGIIGGWSEAQVLTEDWLRQPRIRRFGRFVLSRPQNPEQAGLFVGLVGRPPFPTILVSDDPKQGRPRRFTFVDAAGNTITAIDSNDDGVFEMLGLVTTNGTYQDKWLMGTFTLIKDLAK